MTYEEELKIALMGICEKEIDKEEIDREKINILKRMRNWISNFEAEGIEDEN